MGWDGSDLVLEMFGWKTGGLGSSLEENILLRSGFISFLQNEGTISTHFSPSRCHLS